MAEGKKCILCDSWASCPVNPESIHTHPRTEIIARDVETALLVGYTWGLISPDLCDKHKAMVEHLRYILTPKDSK